MDQDKIAAELKRLVGVVERMSGQSSAAEMLAANREDLGGSDAFVWQAEEFRLKPVPKVNRIALELIIGVDHVKSLLLDNTKRFAAGFSANNALLWGARGMGKSSLVKAVHWEIAKTKAKDAADLKLVEVHREDITSLPALMSVLRELSPRFVLFCDDLSFDDQDDTYKSLKAVLEGGLEGRPDNVLFYATSNRRHLLPRNMIENESSTAINPHEAVEEKVSLSDRFGLWLGFHHCDQAHYLAMIETYAAHFSLSASGEELQRQALEWATTRGARSGRVAWQFIQDLAGREGKNLG